MAVDIRFLGQSCFELTAGGTTVLTDPFLTGNPKAAASADEVSPTSSCSRTATATISATPSTSPSAPAPRWSRSSSSPTRSPRPASRTSSTRTSAAPSRSTGAGSSSSPPGTPPSRPSGTAHMPAGLLIHIGDRLVYHLGDTCLFSDMQLIARRGDKVDIALVPIGGHYTMDRFDAVTAVRVHQPGRGHPLPLRHVPADRDGRRGVQGRRAERGLLAGRACSSPARATRSSDPRDRPHRGRALGHQDPRRRAGRRRGRGRGLLGHGRVGLRGDAAGARPGRGGRRSSPSASPSSRGSRTRRRWSRSRSSRSTTSRRCSRSAH